MLLATQGAQTGPTVHVGERLNQKPRKFKETARKLLELSDKGHLDRSSQLDYMLLDLELRVSLA